LWMLHLLALVRVLVCILLNNNNKIS